MAIETMKKMRLLFVSHVERDDPEYEFPYSVAYVYSC